MKRKPAPDSVNEVLRILGIESKDAIYVGDSDVDMDTAKNANMDAIGVDWGFRGEEFLRNHGASTIVYKPEEILDLV